MTEPTDFEPAETTLPGLDEPERRGSLLADATRQSIRALHAAGLLDERHAMPCQLMLDLAIVVDAGRMQGKASAAAMAAAQMIAAYQLLMPVETEGGSEDGFDQLAADLRAAAAGTLADIERSAAALRDAPESERLD